MKNRLTVCLVLSVLIMVGGVKSAQASEEFVAPFPSWSNVKRDYGAVGDGRADDTEAIQRALDDLRFRKRGCVLFFPSGTYRITKMVRTVRKAHTEGMGMTVVGEDPATTVIRWDGEKGGTMLQYDAWYSTIRRLTLDGAGKAGVCLAYGDAFSTYNETSDMVFKDADVGMKMATADNGQAENAVLRCQFLRCANAGLTTVNFNSMDIWVWYCRFEDCGYGLLNGAGNFHAYENLFLRSKKMDIGARNLMVFSFVNNTSVGSRCFMDWESGFTWGSPCSITGNRIIEPTGDFAIRLGNAGPYLVADNLIKSRAGKTTPEVIMTWADQTFIGNTYTVSDPVVKKGRYRLVDEKVVDASKIKIAMPQLPSTPPHRSRKVFDVPAGANADAIQQAINEATQLKGQKPVVHLPMGVYNVDRTLTVPAGCDVQIIGDGGAETATVLKWTGKAGEPLLKLEGPSRATLRDLTIWTNEGVGILTENCDQPGGKVFGCQVNATGGYQGQKGLVGLLVDGVEQSDVLMRCLQGGTTLSNWVRVVGGRQTGKAEGQVSVFCGATGTSDGPYLVEKGGLLLVRSVYHEVSGDAPQAILLKDAGTLCIDATRFSYATRADKPLIALDGFRGDFTLLTGLLLPVSSEHTARVHVTGNGAACHALVMNNLFWETRYGINADHVWQNEATPPARAALLLNNMNFNVPKTAVPEKQNSGYGALDHRGTADDAFIRRMLSPLRAGRIWFPTETKPGVTDLQIHRVIVAVGKGGKGIELRAGK